MGKYYAIMINSGNRAVPFEKVQATFAADDWLRLNANQYCVYTARSAEALWGAVTSALGNEDFTLVIEIVVTNGWMTSGNPVVTDWFNQTRP